MKTAIREINTINELHRIRELGKPSHPLISLVDYADVKHYASDNHVNWIQNFYSIAMKKNIQGKMRYGHREYHFDEGLMSFLAPKQGLNVIVEQGDENKSGWILFVRPDIMWSAGLAKSMRQYDCCDYGISHALLLSKKEERIMQTIFVKSQQDIAANPDVLSQAIIMY